MNILQIPYQLSEWRTRDTISVGTEWSPWFDCARWRTQSPERECNCDNRHPDQNQVLSYDWSINFSSAYSCSWFFRFPASNPRWPFFKSPLVYYPAPSAFICPAILPWHPLPVNFSDQRSSSTIPSRRSLPCSPATQAVTMAARYRMKFLFYVKGCCLCCVSYQFYV